MGIPISPNRGPDKKAERIKTEKKHDG